MTERACLIGVYKGTGRDLCEEHLGELADLAKTLGVEVVGTLPCAVRTFSASTYIQEGKLEEIKLWLRDVEANLLLFDDEISPAQQRNLEKALGLPVLDRTEVILEIFASRASTKEARLQIELAKTEYQMPRLKRLWTHLSRERGGAVTMRGVGEKQLELDKRLLKEKRDALKRELKEVVAYRKVQRHRRERSGLPSFALVGYTNAGKSTLLNALTDAKVFVQDQLFATLDPTTRRYLLPNHQEILLTDTVGFIRKLPHLLVAAFRSTLEEALHADVLLHVVDVSHPLAEEHAATSCALLKELGASEIPRLTLLNKVDRCTHRGRIDRLRTIYPKTLPLSALTHQGFEELTDQMQQAIASLRRKVELRIPQSDYALVARIAREGLILQQEYEDENVLLKAEIPRSLERIVKDYLLHSN